MEMSREELAERFRERSDEELLSSLESGTLTPLAEEMARLELRSRGKEPASKVETADVLSDSDDAPRVHGVDLVTVAEFWNPLEANLLRGCLQARGVSVQVWGEHLGVAHSFLSAASGGTRLQVPSHQVERAREVIAAFERGDFAIHEAPE